MIKPFDFFKVIFSILCFVASIFTALTTGEMLAKEQYLLAAEGLVIFLVLLVPLYMNRRIIFNHIYVSEKSYTKNEKK